MAEITPNAASHKPAEMTASLERKVWKSLRDKIGPPNSKGPILVAEPVSHNVQLLPIGSRRIRPGPPHRMSYTGIERPTRNVSLVNIDRIAKGLRKSLPDLFTRT